MRRESLVRTKKAWRSGSADGSSMLYGTMC